MHYGKCSDCREERGRGVAMAKIDVSPRVLELIGKLRATAETTENETLERVLEDAAADLDARLRAYEQAEQDVQSTN